MSDVWEEIKPDPYIEVELIRGNVPELTLGSPVQIEYIDPYPETKDYQRFIRIDLYNAKGEFVAYNTPPYYGEKTLTWVPPLEWAQYNTTGNYLTIKYQAHLTRSYQDSTFEIIAETKWITQQIYIPESTKPSVSVTPGDYTDNRETYGAYISGKSKPYMDFTITTAYGATITNLELQILNYTHISSGFWLEQDEENHDKYSGTQDFGGNDGVVYGHSTKVNFEIIVKDSRGYTTTFTLEEPSYPYSHPCISDMTVRRCDSSGTLNSSGSYLRVDFTAAISPLGNKNSAVYTLRYKNKSGNGSYNTISMTSYNGTYSISGYKVFSATATASYDVEMTATDSYGTTTKTAVGLSIKKLWSALKNGLGFAFGKIAEKQNTLDMGFAIYMNSNKIHGLSEPTDTDEAATKNYVDTHITDVNEQIQAIPDPYPVGAIYISTNSTSPASLFGGTWTQITDRFLLAAGSSYSAGGTGGSATHKLTTNEMPSHKHDYILQEHTGWYTVCDWEYSDYAWDLPEYSDCEAVTDSVGGGEAHNNMPPYLVVYMWKRTA